MRTTFGRASSAGVCPSEVGARSASARRTEQRVDMESPRHRKRERRWPPHSQDGSIRWARCHGSTQPSMTRRTSHGSNASATRVPGSHPAPPLSVPAVGAADSKTPSMLGPANGAPRFSPLPHRTLGLLLCDPRRRMSVARPIARSPRREARCRVDQNSTCPATTPRAVAAPRSVNTGASSAGRAEPTCRSRTAPPHAVPAKVRDAIPASC